MSDPPAPPGRPLRIVSLLASATEIVCALGLADRLVGRSHECDYPPSVKQLPACTGPKFDPDGRSYEIDQRVKAIVQEALGIYWVDAARLEALQPTHIITQTQCDVCAVNLATVEAAVCQVASSRPAIVALEPNALADIWRDIRRVGAALGVPVQADRLVAGLQHRIDAIATRSRALAARPSVACLEWLDPLMAAGNWMPELVELAGGRNLFGAAGRHSPWLTWEALAAADPDLILITPCGFDIARTLADLPLLTERAGWHDLRAVRAGRVYVADGNQFFNRPGPRIVESLEILAELCHPATFRFGHAGVDWTSAA
jgi:iron complex transport system substrate-binding protein